MFVDADEAQARAILRAMWNVTRSAGGEKDPSGRGRAMVRSAGRIVFRPKLDVDPVGLGHITPEQLAGCLTTRPLREAAASMIGAASLVDGELDRARLARAVDYASALGVDEDWVHQILETARGHLDWVKADMQRRNAATFPGMELVGNALDEQFLPYTGNDADKALAARYRALDDFDPETFGRTFAEHFRLHGFLLPGEPGAFNEAFSVRHDALHVLSGYDTSVPGELLVSTFTGAMHRNGGIGGHILPVIYEWHIGIDLSFAVPPAHGALEPESFWSAWDRGRAATRDVLDPAWDFWTYVPLPLAEVRAMHGIEPLESP